MTIPDDGSTSTHNERGDGDDGVASGGDGDARSVGLGPDADNAVPDGADGQDVGQATPESSPVNETLRRVGEQIGSSTPFTDTLENVGRKMDELPPGTYRVKVEDGKGSVLVGVETLTIRKITSVDPNAVIQWEESHTVGITKVSVSKATVQDGTVTVTVDTK